MEDSIVVSHEEVKDATTVNAEEVKEAIVMSHEMVKKSYLQVLDMSNHFERHITIPYVSKDRRMFMSEKYACMYLPEDGLIGKVYL